MSKRRVRSAFSPRFDLLGARIVPSTFVPPRDPYAADTSVVMTGLTESGSCDSGPTVYTCSAGTLVLSGTSS